MSEATPNPWAEVIVADPYSAETVTSRLRDLLEGKAVGNVPGAAKGENAKDQLRMFVQQTDWSFKPEAFDAVWQAVFQVGKELGCTEKIRDATYFWTEQNLLHVAQDAIPAEEGDEDDPESGLTDGYDKTWIATAIGDARLYALGYGYSTFAWNAFLDGLGLGGGEENSDSMRIGSCGQLLGAGQRLKLRIHGGGDKHASSGFAGRYLQAPIDTDQGRKDGVGLWAKVLAALEEEQGRAGPKAAALLRQTLEHLQADKDDLTSVQVANIIWPK